MTDRTHMPMTANHWGTYRVEVKDGVVKKLHPFEEDVDPSPIGYGIEDVLDGPTRIHAPMIRQSWLENGPGSAGDKRGSDPFVEVSWDEAERLVADELNRVRSTYGNASIFAGSYGWASAGRFHHAQSQLRRFLNCIGGFTKSVNSYSLAAGEVIVARVLGPFVETIYNQTSWQSIVESAELFVALGGIPIKNGQISQGGVGRHRQREAITQAYDNGVKFVNISPLRSDILDEIDADCIAPRPSTDAALLLALTHTVWSEGLHDQAFLDRYCVGFDKFAEYLDGKTDGVVKSAEWAAPICEISADTIRELARKMASKRTMLSVSWSLTRQDHGEQPFWAAITLAAVLGQIGLPGGGFGMGYSAVNTVGLERRFLTYQAFPQGQNPIQDFIPVARISEMLESPGSPFQYDGQTRNYPDAKIVYWAGGNPFHHHQDLNRMKRAWAKPDTIIAHEWCWNALAKHADIVLPCTTSLERQDLAMNARDPYIVWLDQVIEPVGLARDDFEIFRGIASKMGIEEAFTDGKTAADWLSWMYATSQKNAAKDGVDIPDIDTLRKQGWHRTSAPDEPNVLLSDFRGDPDANPLKTPSGKIEIFSELIDSFGYEDCPGHPSWHEPLEWLGSAKTNQLHLISNQPKSKLHSHLDHGHISRAFKIKEREPVIINPTDAAQRGINDGDIVKVFNERGACLCAAVIDSDIRQRVVNISTGSWFDPDETGMCKHGNPNTLTLDKGTSQLAQGPTAHSCLVEIEKWVGPVPKVTAFDPPEILTR